MSNDDTQDPNSPAPEGNDDPDTTPRYYIAPDGRPHIDENDDDSTNQPEA